jgi:hypothetical protein
VESRHGEKGSVNEICERPCRTRPFALTPLRAGSVAIATVNACRPGWVFSCKKPPLPTRFPAPTFPEFVPK